MCERSKEETKKKTADARFAGHYHPNESHSAGPKISKACWPEFLPEILLHVSRGVVRGNHSRSTWWCSTTTPWLAIGPLFFFFLKKNRRGTVFF